MSLPIEVAPKQMGQLPPSTSCNSLVSNPINGASFTENQQIIFDLVTGRGFLNPNSLYIRYRFTATGMAAGGGQMLGCPVYSPFLQFQMLFNSQVVENIVDYNLYCEDMINVKTDVASKAGLARAFGYGATSSVTPFNFNTVNGRLLGTTPDSFPLSAPLPCLLSQSESYVPLFMFGAVRIILTLDTIANMFNTTNAPSAYTLSNVELCYDVINFDPAVESYYASLANQSGKIVLKSYSVATGSQPLASGSSGSFQLPFNYRLASIKSLLLHNSPAVAPGATTGSGKHTALDITSNNGSYSFEVAQNIYPPRELSTANNKAGIISELCLALFGNKNIASNSLGITPATWDVTSTSYGAGGTDAYSAPGGFLVGVNTERVPSSSSMLTGVSSLLAPINVRLNINTATSQACQIRLFALYDALIEIDVNTREVRILQ
jgi:hypothetical protein